MFMAISDFIRGADLGMFVAIAYFIRGTDLGMFVAISAFIRGADLGTLLIKINNRTHFSATITTLKQNRSVRTSEHDGCG